MCCLSFKLQLQTHAKTCSLQAELKPWTAAFAQLHGRKPTQADAAATGDACIADRFTAMDMLKGRLIGEIPVMRKRLAHRIGADEGAEDAPAPPGLQQKGPIMNSNQPALSREEASARVQSAFEYRKRKLEALLQRKAAAAQKAAMPPAQNAEVPPSQATTAASPPAATRASPATGAVLAGAGGNQRAKDALMKAMKYKKARAAEACNEPASAPQAARPRNAIKLVAVEGRMIGGVSYDVDASAAAAGESACVQTASARVTSYRNLPAGGDEDGLAASAASAASSYAAAPFQRASAVPAAAPTSLPQAPADAGPPAAEAEQAAESSARPPSPAPATVSGRLAGAISADLLAALGALAADVQSEEGAMGVLLELRAKQAAATAAMAYAAATNAAASVEVAGSSSVSEKSSTETESACKESASERPARRLAMAEAARAMRDFEVARQRAKGLLQRSESTPWLARALSAL